MSGLAPRTRAARAAGATLFLIAFAHALVETARDTLVVTHLPPALFPWLHLGAAAAAAAFAFLGRGKDVRRLSAWLLVGAGVLAVLRDGLFDAPTLPVIAALYAWTAVAAAWAMGRVWLVLGDAFDPSEGKRVFARVAGGASAGGLSGSLAAAFLLERYDAASLVGFAAAVTVLAAVGPARWLARTSAGPELAAPSEAFGAGERGAPLYALGLAGLALLATATATFVDLSWKARLADSLAPSAVASRVALVGIAAQLVTLFVQLLFAPRLLRRFGVARAALVLPAGLAATALACGVLGAGPLATATALKLVDGGLRSAIHRLTLELLHLPLPDRARRWSRPLVDLVGNRGGQALAAAALLAVGLAALPALTVAGLVAWVALALVLKPAYLARFRATLGRTRAPEPSVAGATESLPAFVERRLAEALALGDDDRRVGALLALARPARQGVPGLDPDLLGRLGWAAAEAAVRALADRVALGEGTPSRRALRRLHVREQRAIGALFVVLALRYPHEDVLRYLAALRRPRASRSTAERKRRAAARELLDSLLEGPARRIVLVLVSDRSDEEKLSRLLAEPAAAHAAA